MKIRFDSLDRYEVPGFYICNPGSEYNDGMLTRMVGAITNTSDEEVLLNFNATSELNLRAYRVQADGSDESEYAIAMYNSLQNRRYIFVEDIGYFVISDIDDSHEDTGRYKDIRAVSCEVEMQNKSLTNIEDGTYAFLELLEKVIAPVSKWTIAHIDDAVAEKYRTFNDVDINKNTLSFLMEDMQEAYECIFVFDTIRRQIYVYDQNNYVVRTNIHLTKDDLISSLGVSEGTEDLYTALSVFGTDNLSINAVNPLGTTVIYNFDYYLDWMDESLRDKVVAWSDKVKNSYTDNYNYNVSYYEKLEDRSNCTAEIQRIQTQIDMYTRCKENIIASSSVDGIDSYNEEIIKAGGDEDDCIYVPNTENYEVQTESQTDTGEGDTESGIEPDTESESTPESSDEPVSIDDVIQATLDEIDRLIGEAEVELNEQQAKLEEIASEIEALQESINQIRESVAIANYFTQDEYAELSDFIYEGTYTDEYVITTDIMTQPEKFEQMNLLYERAQKRLQIISYPSQEFNVEVEDFIFQKKFQEWSEQLETGCLINVELDPGDIAELFLSAIQLNWHDHKLSFTFGNRFNKFDPKTLFDDVLGDIQKSTNSIEYIREILYPIKSGKLDEFAEALSTSRTLTMNGAITSTNQDVTIDGSGYTGRKLLSDGTYDPHQVKISNNSIVFTSDAWDSCDTALGLIHFDDGTSTYGVNAKSVIGDMIIGGELHIKDASGTDILTVVDNKVSSRVEGVEEKVTGENGLEKTVSSLSTSVEQSHESLKIQIGRIDNIDKEGVARVTTTSGYTFNEDGLTISNSDQPLCNRLTYDGMYVFVKNENSIDPKEGDIVLQANGDGVIAKDVTIRNYLIVGDHARFEDYVSQAGGNRTACFYV